MVDFELRMLSCLEELVRHSRDAEIFRAQVSEYIRSSKKETKSSLASKVAKKVRNADPFELLTMCWAIASFVECLWQVASKFYQRAKGQDVEIDDVVVRKAVVLIIFACCYFAYCRISRSQDQPSSTVQAPSPEKATSSWHSAQGSP